MEKDYAQIIREGRYDEIKKHNLNEISNILIRQKNGIEFMDLKNRFNKEKCKYSKMISFVVGSVVGSITVGLTIIFLHTI